MATATEHREALRALDDWEPYLRAHSGLPGPRANLELVQAAGRGRRDAALEPGRPRR